MYHSDVGSQEPVHMDLKRDYATHARREGSSSSNSSLFEKYQFFTPGSFRPIYIYCIFTTDQTQVFSWASWPASPSSPSSMSASALSQVCKFRTPLSKRILLRTPRKSSSSHSFPSHQRNCTTSLSMSLSLYFSSVSLLIPLD